MCTYGCAKKVIIFKEGFIGLIVRRVTVGLGVIDSIPVLGQVLFGFRRVIAVAVTKSGFVFSWLQLGRILFKVHNW